jgi:hypothetical protein
VIWLFPQRSRLPQAFAAAADVTNTGRANICPAGTVAGEIADTEPELRLWGSITGSGLDGLVGWDHP